MMLPSVSVVIPAYKAASWIAETLDSVVRQSYPADHLEIIVAVDASPDDSAAIAQEFLDRHRCSGRVTVRDRNGGVSACRNSGWKLATGEWIQFLDADDLLAPHKVALQADAAGRAKDSVAVVYSSWQHLLLEQGEWRASGSVNAPFVDDDPLLRILQEFDFGYVGPTLIRRSFLELVGGFDENLDMGEDADLMLRMAMAGGQFRQALSPGPGLYYRQWPGSSWRSAIKNVRAMRNLNHSYRRVEEFLRSKSPHGALSAPVRLALARRYSRFADLYIESDPETYAAMKLWLQELGMTRPLDLTPRLEVLSKVLGYENAVRVRSAFRNQVQRFRRAPA